MAKTLTALYVLDSTGVARGVDQAKAKLAEMQGSASKMGDTFDRQTSRAGSAFKGLGNTLGSFGIPFSGSVTRIGEDLDRAKSHASGYGQVLADTGKVAGGIAAAGLAAFAVESVKMAGDFQQQMSKLITSGGEMQSNLKGDYAGVEALMASTGTSSQQLAAGLYTINSAGFHGAAGLQVLKAAAQGAKTENADVSVVTDGLTTMLNDYGLKASAAAEVTSKMVRATSLGKTSFQDLAGALHTVSPAAQAAGISMNEVLGAMATMTAKGTPAADAATYLRQTILQLSNPTKKASDEMAGLGLSAFDVSSKLGQRGLTGTLDVLTKAIAAHVQGGAVMVDNLKQAAAAGSGWAQKLQQMTPAEQAQIQSLAGMGVQAAQARSQLDLLAASGAGARKSTMSLSAATNLQTSAENRQTSATAAQEAAQARLQAAQARLGALQQQYGITDVNTAAAAQQRLTNAEARQAAVMQSLAGKTTLTAAEQNRLAAAQQAVATAQAKLGTAGSLTAAEQNSLAAAQRAVDTAQQSLAASGNRVASAQGAAASAAAKLADAQSGGVSSTSALRAQIDQYNAALATLPPAARKVLAGLVASKQGFQDLNSTIAKLPPAQQTAVGALANMVGGTKSMQAALELTGVSAGTFQANVKKIAGTTTEAGGNVAGWAVVQKNFNQQLAEAKQTVNELAIRFGTMLIPYLQEGMQATKDVVVWFEKHKTAAEALAGVIGGVLTVAFAAFTVNKIAGMINGVRSAGSELRSLEQTTVRVAQTLLEKFGIMRSSAEESSAGVGQAADRQAGQVEDAANRQAAGVEQAATRQAGQAAQAAEQQSAQVSQTAAQQAAQVEGSASTQAAQVEAQAARQAAGVETSMTGMASTAEATATGMETSVAASAASMSTVVQADVSGMAAGVDGEVGSMAASVDGEIGAMAASAESQAAGMAASVEAEVAAATASEGGMGGMGMLGAAGGAFGGGMMAYQGYQGSGVGSDLSLIGGSALTGAMIGSVVPGLGTGVGAAVGAGIGGGLDLYKHFFKAAAGGVVTSPTIGLVGEAGPELILPLSDPGRMMQLIGANASALPTGGAAGSGAHQAAGATGRQVIYNVTVNVAGSVAAEQDLARTFRDELIKLQMVNGVLFQNTP